MGFEDGREGLRSIYLFHVRKREAVGNWFSFFSYAKQSNRGSEREEERLVERKEELNPNVGFGRSISNVANRRFGFGLA